MPETSGSSCTAPSPAIPEAVPAFRRAAGQFAAGLGAAAPSWTASGSPSPRRYQRDPARLPRPREPGPVELTAALEGAELLVTVRDEGMGMARGSTAPGSAWGCR